MDLRSLYYDPRTGLSSLEKFYRRAREYNFTRPEVASFLARQEVHQLNKQTRQTPYFPIWGAPNTYQADLMFMDDYRGWRYILCIIDVNTRKAWCYALKRKSDTPAIFIEWMKTHKVRVIQVDAGSEFNNRTVKNYTSTHGITLRTVAPGLSTDQGKVERFNGTLRHLITLYKDAYKTDDWVTDLPKLVENYNSRQHTALGTSPDEATDHTSDAKNRVQYDRAELYFDSFAYGSRVRRLINKKKSRFYKGRKQWSREVYEIDHIQFHQFHLKGYGWVKSWEVQHVPENTESYTMPETRVPTEVVRKAKKVTRDLRKAGVTPANVTEELRTKKAPTAFVAEPAPNPRTLPRDRPAKSVKTKTPADPGSVKVIEVREKGKYYFGRVGARLPNGKYVVNFDDGSEGEYSPADVLRFKWTPNAAQRARLKKDPTWSPI